MVYSMTAFARSESSTDQGSLVWELRSVNHRYLEVSLRLPEAFRDLEGPLRERLRKEIARGKLECTLRFNPSSDSSQQLSLNQPLIAQLIEAASQISGQLPAPAPINPLELLSSDRFANIIKILADKYDRVIIDSAPTQAVSDALVLSRHANAVIYVVKSEATAIPLVQAGVGKLLQMGAPVKGVVLNQLDVKKAAKYGYSYGGYYDYYGYSNTKAEA